MRIESLAVKLYSRVYDANVRLCERLGVEEDTDVNIIIDSMNEITRILVMKMYDYGANREMFDQK